MQFERLNPLTGEVASSAPAMKAGDIPAVAARAAAAFPVWAAMVRMPVARCLPRLPTGLRRAGMHSSPR